MQVRRALLMRLAKVCPQGCCRAGLPNEKCAGDEEVEYQHGDAQIVLLIDDDATSIVDADENCLIDLMGKEKIET